MPENNVVAVSRMVRVTEVFEADADGNPVGYVEDSEPPERVAPPRVRRGSGVPFERHFTTSEVAELWNVSADFVRDLFRDEVGVLSLERTGSKKYTTYRIPESVMLRVHAQMVRKC